MKKAISVILTLTMVVCSLPLFGVVSVATNNALTVGGVYNITIPNGETVTYTFTPSVSGLYFLSSTGSTDTHCSLFNIADETVTLCESEISRGDSVNFSLGFDLQAGESYKYVVSAQKSFGMTYTGQTTLTFTKEKVIKSITNAQYDHNVIVHTEGNYSNYYPDFQQGGWVQCAEYFYYAIDFTKLTGTITYEDDTMVTGQLSDYIFVDNIYMRETQSPSNEYSIGSNTVDFAVYDSEIFSFNLQIVASTVSSISAVINPNSSVINCNGYYANDQLMGAFNSNSNTPNYYSYYFNLDDNLESLTVNFTNGDSRTFTNETATVNEQLLEAYGYVATENHPQSYDYQWTTGNNAVGIEFMGASTTVNFNIANSNIKSIECELTKTSSCINTDGEKVFSNYFDSTTQQWKTDEWYYYHIEVSMLSSVTITLNNDEVKTYTGDNIWSDIKAELGYEVYVITTQQEEHWGVGAHEVTIVIADAIQTIDYTIEASPIESISFKGPFSFVEGTNRSTENWYNEFGEIDGNYNCYHFSVQDFGDVTVKF